MNKYFILIFLISTTLNKEETNITKNEDPNLRSTICPTSCRSCRFGTTQCSSCYDGKYLTSYGSCSSCRTGCKRCSSYTSCSSCENGYYMSYSSCNSCGAHCSSCSSANNCHTCYGGYFNDGGRCVQCTSGCSKCRNRNQCEICNLFNKLTSDYQCTFSMSTFVIVGIVVGVIAFGSAVGAGIRYYCKYRA